MDIFKDIEEIPALAEFSAENNTLDAAPIEQRVQAFVAELFGGAWHSATILAWTTPTGETIYAAFGPVGRPSMPGMAMRLVGERADGTLAFCPPVPLSDHEPEEHPEADVPLGASLTPDPFTDLTYRSEAMCLATIMPALREASEIIGAAEQVKRCHKKRLKSQIAHAIKHLELGLERMRREEKEL